MSLLLLLLLLLLLPIIQGICHYLNYLFFFFFARPIVVLPNIAIDPGPNGSDLLRRFQAPL